MKKIITLLIVAVLVVVASGCGKSKVPADADKKVSTNAAAVVVSTNATK